MDYLAPPNRMIMHIVVFFAVIGLVKTIELLINRPFFNLWYLLICMAIFLFRNFDLFKTALHQ